MGGTAEKRPPPPTARSPNAPLQPGFARAVDRACSAFTAPRAHELWKTAGRPVGTLSGRDRGPRRRPTALRVEAPAPAAEGPLLGALGRELAAPRALCPPPRLCVSNLPGADLTSVFKGRGEGDNRKPGPCVLSTSEMLLVITDAGPGSVLRSPWVGTVSATMTRASRGADEVALLAQGRPERGRPVLFGPGHVEQGQTWRTRCRGERARRGGEHCAPSHARSREQTGSQRRRGEGRRPGPGWRRGQRLGLGGAGFCGRMHDSGNIVNATELYI